MYPSHPPKPAFPLKCLFCILAHTAAHCGFFPQNICGFGKVDHTINSVPFVQSGGAPTPARPQPPGHPACFHCPHRVIDETWQSRAGGPGAFHPCQRLSSGLSAAAAWGWSWSEGRGRRRLWPAEDSRPKVMSVSMTLGKSLNSPCSKDKGRVGRLAWGLRATFNGLLASQGLSFPIHKMEINF